ncbi:MAG: MarR family transcriptional regulator [Flavobacteriales bacterium]|nr:MAG: MarR family transcriptional regulator [Flavobacteriales bacterium]
MSRKDTVDHRIKSTWHNMFKMYNQVASKYGTTQATGLVLLSIDREGTPSTYIATSLGMEATSMSRIMKTLDENGLIYRKKDKKDKRVVKIFLTEKGVKKRKIAKKVVTGFHDLIGEEIPQSKLSMFFEVMESINGVIDRYKEQNETK